MTYKDRLNEHLVKYKQTHLGPAAQVGGVCRNVPNGAVRVTNYLILRDFQTHETRSNRVNFPTF